jgi:hypothetical protein
MRRIGLALGLVLALAAVLSWRIPGGTTALGAQARFVAVAPGELTLAPAGSFLTLRPSSGSARGSLSLRNIAGAPLTVELRARPSSRELDRWLRVRIGGRGVRLRALRRWTRVASLAPGERRRLPASARLPATARDRAAGALVDVTVEVRAEVERG